MKRILSICLILLAPVMVFAQAGLPPCQETHSQIRWDGCWGSFRLWNGSRIEGEFRDGELTGFGIESSSDGKTIRAGRWRAWSFVEAVPLEKISLPQAYFLARDQAAREFLQQLTSLSGGSWRDRLDRAIQNSLRQWPLHGSQDLVEVPPPAYPAALVLKQEPWETNAEFEGRLEKARTDRRTAIDRLESEYRTKVEERNRRVADFNKTRREREESLPQRRRTLVLLGLGALAPRVALSDAALDQQSGSLTVAVRVEDLEQQIFAFAGTSQDFRRIALTEPQNLRAKPEFEVTDKGEITLRAVSLEVGAATARGLPAAGPASQLQLATVTLPQIQSGPLPQQSAVAVDRNQVEQILYREENESLRRRLEEQRRQQEQAVANAEARASAEIARLKAEADALRSQPGQSRPSPALASVREAHALVIGNSAYPGSSRLVNPVNDARAMANKLRSLGFRVTEVPNATREQLVRGLSDFTRTASRADLTLLFYAGHGVQIGGVNYMIPVDMSLNDPAQAALQGVSLNSVVEQYMPGRTKLVFLDACRDNPLMASVGRGITKGLAPINVSEGTLIAYATKDGQVAEDGVGQTNSPFTAALLEHLADPDDIAVVLRTVRAKVMQRTSNRQQPWEYGSLTGGALVLSAIAGVENSGPQQRATLEVGRPQQPAPSLRAPQAARDSGSVPSPGPAGHGSGAVAQESGAMTYRLVRAGSGASPGPTDTVRVHYRGTFPDGREFDSSHRRDQPAQFPLNRVIRCWTEGIQMMRVGGRATFICPPDTAYGERGTPGGPIPSNATLHFEVELLQIVR